MLSCNVRRRVKHTAQYDGRPSDAVVLSWASQCQVKLALQVSKSRSCMCTARLPSKARGATHLAHVQLLPEPSYSSTACSARSTSRSRRTRSYSALLRVTTAWRAGMWVSTTHVRKPLQGRVVTRRGGAFSRLSSVLMRHAFQQHLAARNSVTSRSA